MNANAPVIGQLWRSEKLKGTFRVLGGPEAVPGLREWASQMFVGHKAQRTSDGKCALVGLTDKPKEYPYDWVLIH